MSSTHYVNIEKSDVVMQILRDKYSFRTNKLDDRNLRKSLFYGEEWDPNSSGVLKHLLSPFPTDVTFPMLSLHFTIHLSAHGMNFTNTDF